MNSNDKKNNKFREPQAEHRGQATSLPCPTRVGVTDSFRSILFAISHHSARLDDLSLMPSSSLSSSNRYSFVCSFIAH
eukprot:scaffold4501_cov118-Cylindrotheca_fusiformis.AAC.6